MSNSTENRIFLCTRSLPLIKYFTHTHFVVAALDHSTHSHVSCQANVCFFSSPSHPLALCPHPLHLFHIHSFIDAQTNGECAKHTRLRLHWKLFMRHAYFSNEILCLVSVGVFLIDSGMCAVCTSHFCRYTLCTIGLV